MKLKASVTVAQGIIVHVHRGHTMYSSATCIIPLVCGSAPKAQAIGEHRWRHTEHLLFECQCISGLDSYVAMTLVRDDFFRFCSGSVHANFFKAVFLTAFTSHRVPGVAAMACIVPFLLNPAAVVGRVTP